jgi:hypothetical protein
MARAWHGVQAQDLPQISGTVVDDADNPLGDVEVLLFVHQGDGWDYTNRLDTTKEDGYFVVDVPAPGTYTLSFSDRQARFLITIYDRQTDWTNATAIEIADGSVALGAVHLLPATRIGGHVTRATDGSSLPEVLVTLYSTAPDDGSTWLVKNSQTTGDDGLYSFGALADGTYRVGLEHVSSPPRYAPAFYPGSARTLAEAEDIEVSWPAIRDDVDVALAPYAMITGAVTSTEGGPLADIYACLRAADAPPPPSGLWLATDCVAYKSTDADGHYALTGLLGGDYEMRFFDLEWPPRFHDAPWNDQPGSSQPAPLVLRAGETRTEIDASLRPAGFIAGTVLGPESMPLGGVDVRLYQQAGAGDDGWRWLQSARTDTRDALLGRFTFQTVISDTFRVGFVDPLGRYAPDFHAGVPTLGKATGFHLPTGARVEHIAGALQTGGTVTGCVRDAAGLTAGAEVNLYAGGVEWRAQTLTDEEGCYRFTGVGAGNHVVRVRDDAGALTPASSAPLSVAAGKTLALADIVLADAPTLGPSPLITTTGHVRTEAGDPVVGAVVNLYKVPGLRARVFAWDAEPFTCPSAASLADPPLWDTPAPAVGAVFAYPAAEGLEPAVNPQLTDASGAYGWKLPPGCWFVRVEAGYASGVSAVAGAPPRVTNLDVVLPPPPTPTPTQMPTIAPTSTKAPPPAPTATRTAAPTATRTPLPNPTSAGAATAAPTASATGTSTSTATNTATATPAPSPSTPTPGGGSTPDAVTPTPDLRVLLPVVQK